MEEKISRKKLFLLISKSKKENSNLINEIKNKNKSLIEHFQHDSKLSFIDPQNINKVIPSTNGLINIDDCY